MKKFICVMALALSSVVSVFAMGTVNIGAKTNGCEIIGSVGYDLLVHSFDNSELWVEPKIDIVGATIDNSEKAISVGFGMNISNVLISNGIFYGVAVDYTRSNICQGITTGLELGVKMYNYKLFAGVDKGFYFCKGDNLREKGNKYPWMLSLGAEIFF